jgi:hypothetical protein
MTDIKSLLKQGDYEPKYVSLVNGELEIESKINGKYQKQVLMVEPPCLLLYNTMTNSYTASPIHLEPEEIFVQLIENV